MVYFFSGTGNSEYVARQISASTFDKVESITPLVLLKSKVCPPECVRIGFVFPVYGWNLPPVVSEFFNLLDFSQLRNTYLYIVFTCGDDSGKIVRCVRREFAQRGAKLAAAFSVQMPNTYVSLPGFNIDPPEVAKRKLEASKSEIATISSKILALEPITFNTRPGSFPWIKTYVVGKLFQRFLMSDHRFTVTSQCNGCSLCARICPMKNIRISHSFPLWLGNCTGCLACYHHCPKHAIQQGSSTRHKGQYLFSKNKDFEFPIPPTQQ